MRDNQPNDELLDLVAKLTDLIQQQTELHIPASIFSSPLSPAEALVTYLKDHKQLRLSEIASQLNRDQRGIWSTYNRGKQKGTITVTNGPSIPCSIFKDRQLSVLEHTVHHLRQEHNIKTIADMLGKSPSTIAAVHHRVRRKLS